MDKSYEQFIKRKREGKGRGKEGREGEKTGGNGRE
jgi:hypothetical protein